MKSIIRFLLIALTLIVHAAPMHAQEVSIPDPGQNAAIRYALQKPIGPPTQQDLLGSININTDGRSISTVEGLEAARNLRILDLDNNSITNFTIAAEMMHHRRVDNPNPCSGKRDRIYGVGARQPVRPANT